MMRRGRLIELGDGTGRHVLVKPRPGRLRVWLCVATRSGHAWRFHYGLTEIAPTGVCVRCGLTWRRQ